MERVNQSTSKETISIRHRGIFACLIVGDDPRELVARLRAGGERFIFHYAPNPDKSRPAPGIPVFYDENELRGGLIGSIMPRVQALRVYAIDDVDQSIVDHVGGIGRESIEAATTSGNTVSQFGGPWLRHILTNMVDVLESPTLADLRDTYKGGTAILCGAGPSLTAELDTIKEMADDCLVVCASRSMATLQAAGITPDIVLCVDSQPLMFHLDGLDLSNTYLGVCPNVDPGMLAFKSRGLFTFSANQNLDNWVYDMLGVTARLPTGGSVMTGATSLAVIMGCKYLLTVGVDMAYQDGRVYADGAKDSHITVSVEDGKIVHSGAVSAAADIIGKAPDIGAVEVEGWEGAKVWTSKAMDLTRVWFETAAQNTEATLINCSKGGSLFRGCRNEELAAVRDEVTPKERMPKDFWPERPKHLNKKNLAGIEKRFEAIVKAGKRASGGARNCQAKLKALDDTPQSWSNVRDAESKLLMGMGNARFLMMNEHRPTTDAVLDLVEATDLEAHYSATEDFYKATAFSIDSALPMLTEVYEVICRKIRRLRK